MQGIGAIVLCIAAWLFFCGTQSFRPVGLARAIIADPKNAAQTISSARQYVSASHASAASSTSVNTSVNNGPLGTIDGQTIGDPLATGFHQGDAFGARGGEHKGDDLQVPAGTPVLAATSGVVTYAGLMTNYGNYIKIDNGHGIQTVYGHMESLNVKAGDRVTQGQQIALSGGQRGLVTSGDSTGPHLHFEILQNGSFIDPGPFVQRFSKFING